MDFCIRTSSQQYHLLMLERSSPRRWAVLRFSQLGDTGYTQIFPIIRETKRDLTFREVKACTQLSGLWPRNFMASSTESTIRCGILRLIPIWSIISLQTIWREKSCWRTSSGFVWAWQFKELMRGGLLWAHDAFVFSKFLTDPGIVWAYYYVCWKSRRAIRNVISKGLFLN